MIILSPAEFHALSSQEQVDFLMAQSNETLAHMVAEDYILQLDSDLIQKERGSLSPKRHQEILEADRKISRDMGLFAVKL